MKTKKTSYIKSSVHMTEVQMREEKVPRIKTINELKNYIDALVDHPHDYCTAVYATSMSAVAAFNYVASKLFITGWQASCADLDVIARTRGWKGPFTVLSGEDLLYPQYDLHAELEESIANWQGWAALEARKKLVEHANDAHPEVVAHWKKLAGVVTATKKFKAKPCKLIAGKKPKNKPKMAGRSL